jgi:uncharacterized membrane protein YqjE
MESPIHDPEVIEEKGTSADITVARIEAQPTGELIKSFLRETRNLVRDEVHLAKLELKQEGKKAAVSAIALGAGIAVSFAGFLVLAFGLVFLLAKVMDAWLAAFIVAAVLFVAAFVVLESAIHKLKGVHLKPEEALRTIKEDGQWIKETLRDLRSPRPGTT